jgi:hypothetical protein
MKYRILHIIVLFVMSLMAVSCSATFEDDHIRPNDDNYITLSFSTPGVTTRGEVADN